MTQQNLNNYALLDAFVRTLNQKNAELIFAFGVNKSGNLEILMRRDASIDAIKDALRNILKGMELNSINPSNIIIS